jgi:hypothetical protein
MAVGIGESGSPNLLRKIHIKILIVFFLEHCLLFLTIYFSMRNEGIRLRNSKISAFMFMYRSKKPFFSFKNAAKNVKTIGSYCDPRLFNFFACFTSSFLKLPASISATKIRYYTLPLLWKKAVMTSWLQCHTKPKIHRRGFVIYWKILLVWKIIRILLGNVLPC